MKGRRDVILGAALLIVIVALMVNGLLSDREPHREGEFDASDYYELAQKYPGGTFMPDDRDPAYYRLCREGVWARLYPSGRFDWTDTDCWK